MQQISPYNKINTLINGKVISNILRKYDIDINVGNLSIYQQAFTNDSYTRSQYNVDEIKENRKELESKNIRIVDLQPESNQRLEMLGDTIIKCIITEYIYARYYDQQEGFLTCLKTRLEDTKSLAKYARRMNLGYYMLISKQIEDNNGRDSEKILEDTFESFIAALYIDQGFEIVRKLLRIFLETEIDYAKILCEDNNYMKRLQEFYHDNKWSHPTYIDIKDEKINGKDYYTVCVLDYNGIMIEEAIVTAQSKKIARQESSRLALINFGQINPDL